MNNTGIALAILIMTLVTMALRFAPFLVFGNGRKVPDFVKYLGRMLPYAIMGMLVVYCFRGISFKSASGFVPDMIAAVLVVVSYIYKRNTLISILLGTVVYMVLVQTIFV